MAAEPAWILDGLYWLAARAGEPALVGERTALLMGCEPQARVLSDLAADVFALVP